MVYVPVNKNEFMTITKEKAQCTCCLKKIHYVIHYRCIMCNNYLLCEDCEIEIYHKHPLLKIKTDSQSLNKVLYIGIEDLPMVAMKEDVDKTK